MLGFYCLCFIILAEVNLAHAMVPGVLEIVSPNLRTKREDSPGGSNIKETSSAISPLFELTTDVSFVDGGFKAVISFLPNKDCTCGTNHICVGQDNNSNFVSRCIRDQRCKENVCKNGGTCVQNGSTTKCNCLTGFQGEDCSESGGDAPYSLHFTVAPTDRTLKKGQSHTEECAVEVPAGEEVQYEWTFNEEKIQAYSIKTESGTKIKNSHGVLQIDEITDKMEGNYSCIATTSSGRAKHTFEYRIGDCNVKIYPGPESQNKKINENVFLTCQVDSEDTEVRWKKNGIYIAYDKFPRYQKLSNNALLITDIAHSDTGLYQCEAQDINGCYNYREEILNVNNVKPTNTSCSGVFKGIDTDSGDLIYTAPEYENNKECIIVVRNNQLPRHVVQVEFLYFDIEDSDDCMSDSLKVISGERADSAPLGGPYCGKSLHGRTFLTSGNSLRLEFKTDGSFAHRGFKAKISFVPSKGCTCEGINICIRQDHEKKCIRGQQCRANTCQNGGTCVKTSSTQTCYCVAGFQGDDCSESEGWLSDQMRFTVAPGDRALKRDESHTEQCAVEVPHGERVKYEWTFNGALIEAYNRRTGFGSHPGGVLQIDKFTDELEGQYSCFATTSSGTAEHTFEYRLVEDCDVRIYPGPQSESKKINENALLICHVDSRAREVRWKKDGVYINFDNNPRFRKMVNNYLHISDVELSDAGTYQCEAEDNNGCYSYKEGTLTVIDVQPLKKYCGISVFDEVNLASSRISKGTDARPNENPWHVTLRSRGGSNRHRAYCGGTLISKRYVMTAATCIVHFEEVFAVPFVSENVVILLGTTDCLLTGDETTRTFKSFIVHPKFGDQAPYDNDIALIELDSPVEYTDSIRPVCLEPSDYNDRVFLENSDSLSPVPGKVTGCGKKRKRGGYVIRLQELHVPYVNRDDCENSLGNRKRMLTSRMFCAGSKIARTGGTCGGDAGGGLVMATATRWVQTGIVSWGLGCDVDKYYDIYTGVGMFYDWIEGITHFSEEEVPDFLNLR